MRKPPLAEECSHPDRGGHPFIFSRSVNHGVWEMQHVAHRTFHDGCCRRKRPMCLLWRASLRLLPGFRNPETRLGSKSSDLNRIATLLGPAVSWKPCRRTLPTLVDCWTFPTLADRNFGRCCCSSNGSRQRKSLSVMLAVRAERSVWSTYHTSDISLPRFLSRVFSGRTVTRNLEGRNDCNLFIVFRGICRQQDPTVNK